MQNKYLAKEKSLAVVEKLQGSNENITMTPIIELTEPVRYTTFKNLKGITKTDMQSTWPEIVSMLRNPDVHASKESCPLLVMATFGDKPTASGCTRHAGNVLTVTGIETDHDAGQMSIDEASDTLRMFGIRAVLYSSASHRPDHPRWRILLPLSHPHAPDARHGLVARVNGLLGGVLAVESFTLSQSYYYGKVEGVTYEVRESNGLCIDEAEFLIAGSIGPHKTIAADPIDPEMILPPASDERLADLKSALAYLAGKGQADHYPEYSSVGMALKAESRNGREAELQALFLEFSRGSTRFSDESEVLRDWERFNGDRTGIEGGVFLRAQSMGWINPATGRASDDFQERLKQAKPNTQRYKLLSAADLHDLPPLSWCVRGVLPTVGLAALYGPSASGKSFLAFDMAAAIAEGKDWFACRVKAAPVVYAALEGEAGFKGRAQAWEVNRDRALPDSLQMMMQPFILTAPQDVIDLAAVVPAGSVVFLDTLNRAAPTADENSSKDMGLILQAAKALQALTEGLVIVVHHTGKSTAAGMRGHSSLFAAMDAAIEVRRTGDMREWGIAKSKDGQDGGAHQFTLEIKTLGNDEYGDAITSCVVVPEVGRMHEPKPLTASLQYAMDTFQAACVGGAGVHRDMWRSAFYSSSTAENPEAKRKAFNRAAAELVKSGKLTVKDDVFSLPCLF